MEPAVLLVGGDDTTRPAIEAALSRHKIFVETGSIDTVVDSVVAAAPDLIVLIGEAAEDCGSKALSLLATSPQSSVIPVAIIDDNAELDARLRAFRHGATAVIPRSASIDAIAGQIAKLAREIPERGGASLGLVGEATLHDFVHALSKELRSGILSVKPQAGEDNAAVRLVLGSGRPLANFIDDFVRRVRQHVVLAEPLTYEFDERATGTVQVLGGEAPDVEVTASAVRDLRVVLADDDAARADRVSHELRTHGATVLITDLAPGEMRIARLRQIDPGILMIGEQQLQGQGYELVRKMRSDTRLRWASLLVVQWDQIWSDDADVFAIDRLTGTLAALGEPERSLTERANTRVAFDTRLEVVGPARTLRALSKAKQAVRLTVHNPRVRVEVDLSDGLIVGASGQMLEGEPAVLEGATALSALLVLSSGRLHVEPVRAPATANLMTTIDVGLNMADAEPPPLAPSIPSAAAIGGSLPPTSVAPASRQTASPHAAAPSPVQAAIPRAPAVPGAFAAAQPGTAPRAAQTSAAPVAARASAVPGVHAPRPAVPSALAKKLPAPLAGVSRRTAAVLIALAALQGLLMVLVLRAIFSSGDEMDEAAGPVESAAAAPVKAAAPAPKPAAPEKAAAAATPARDPDLPPEKSAEPTDADAGAKAEEVDAAESEPVDPADASEDVRAPTCEFLLEDSPARAGPFPGAANEQVRIGNRQLVLGNINEAQRAYCKAVLWDANNPNTLLGLAQLLLLRRDGSAAALWAEKVVQLDPGNTRARSLLGDAWARVGKGKEARAEWLTAAGMDPRDITALPALAMRDQREAQRSLDNHDYHRAERFFRRAVIENPRSVAGYAGLANALLKLGDIDAALKWARRAKELDRRNADVRVVLGDVLKARGDTKEAIAEWEQAVIIDPNHYLANQRLRRENQPEQ